MAFLLSAAWWGQKLTGPLMQALAAALAVGAILLGIVGGLWWLRYDAANEARQAMAAQTANARLQTAIYRQQRIRQAWAIGVKADSDLAARLDEQARINADLTAKLTTQQAEAVCYPQDVVPHLNK